VDAVGDRAVVVQGREDFLDPRDDGVDARDVQESLLLSGERRVRQILGGGTGANRNRDFARRVTLKPL